MRRITPCLWFDGFAEEAANHYVSIFPNSKITEISRYGDAGPLPKGTVLTFAFELDGQPLHRTQWRTAVQVHRSRIVPDPLRDAG